MTLIPNMSKRLVSGTQRRYAGRVEVTSAYDAALFEEMSKPDAACS